MQPKNYYKILGVTGKATSDDIRRAFRELAKKLHPDKNPGNKRAEEAFKEVQEAYATLSDPVKRSKYDLKLRYGEERASHQPKSASSSTGQQRKTYNSYTYRARSRSRSNAAVSPLSVMITLTAVIVFIYFASTHFGGVTDTDTTPAETSKASIIQSSTEEKPAEIYPISNADSPYDSVFGTIVYDTSAHNSIYLYNSGYSEAIVCIAEAKAPYRTIRNEYIGKGVKFKLDGIPDGTYYAKVYYGNKWSFSKKVGRAAGGFNEELGFVSYNKANMLFDMRQKHNGNIMSFSSYQLTLDPRDTSGSIMLTAEQFFH